MTRRRRLIFGVAASMLSFVVALALFAAVDVYLHWRTQELAGVNIWGYRGRPVGRKRPNEIRLAMLGGSTAFGYGLPPRESIPAFLERRLNADAPGRGRHFVAVNLGAPGQGATVPADLAIDSPGFDISPSLRSTRPRQGPRRRAAACVAEPFALAGSRPYSGSRVRPSFPGVQESVALRFGGDLNAAWAWPVVFGPRQPRHGLGSGRRREIGQSLRARIGGSRTGLQWRSPDGSACALEECCGWSAAVAWCLSRNRRVLVVTQPTSRTSTRAASERVGHVAGAVRRRPPFAAGTPWIFATSRRLRRPAPVLPRTIDGGALVEGDGIGAVNRFAVAAWTAAGAVALLWPGRALGLLDGMPLNGATEAVLVGLVVPALWWLDRSVLAKPWARFAIVALLVVKAGGLLLTPQGLCARFSTSSPLVGNILTIPVEEPGGFLRSWDVRADWRAQSPVCTAIVDRPYRSATDFPAWFVNVLDFIRPGRRDLTVDLSGYVRVPGAGVFSLAAAQDMTLAGTVGTQTVSAAAGQTIEVTLALGIQPIRLHGSLSGDRWSLIPLWNGVDA